ncbi:Charged multivesicular body protein 6-like [Oopsacas minuta]|uniref:Charged multivesicular body protein 6-like n=1 Tax=Oopsacas minuta TaxID=111878 RepID=A0AAV7K1L9_9METZ|nr:Charged multivesicular body protein 6-like [Oopsacas minuta]
MGALLARIFNRDQQNAPPPINRAHDVSQQDQAVLDLKLQRDKLKRYQNKLEIQMEKERELAKKLLRDGKRDKAKLLLKKKKYTESLLEKTDGQLSNLETMVGNLEYAQIEMKVVEGLKSGNEALTMLHKIMSIEDVESLIADTQDAIEYQKEIDELLGTRLTQEDEESLLKELEQITQGEDEALINQLPAAPVGGLEDEIAPVRGASKQPEKRTAIAT